METIKLELKDWKDMEIAAIEQIRTGKKMEIIGIEILTIATINIHKLHGVTEAETINQVKKEGHKSVPTGKNSEKIERIK